MWAAPLLTPAPRSLTRGTRCLVLPGERKGPPSRTVPDGAPLPRFSKTAISSRMAGAGLRSHLAKFRPAPHTATQRMSQSAGLAPKEGPAARAVSLSCMHTQEPTPASPVRVRGGVQWLVPTQAGQLLRMLMAGPSSHSLGCSLASGTSKKSTFVMLMYSQDAEVGSRPLPPAAWSTGPPRSWAHRPGTASCQLSGPHGPSGARS